MISQETINEIKNKIIKMENPQKIILFGSYAKGNPNDKSDLDLLVIKESDLIRPKRGRDLKWDLADYPFETDLLIKTPQEFAKWQDVEISFNAKIKREGKVLYEQKV